MPLLTRPRPTCSVRLFREWDEDGDGRVSRQEFRRAMPMLGIKASRDEVDDLFDAMDQDGSGSIEYLELKDLLESEANGQEFPKSPLLARNQDAEDEPKGCCQRKCGRSPHVFTSKSASGRTSSRRSHSTLPVAEKNELMHWLGL